MHLIELTVQFAEAGVFALAGALKLGHPGTARMAVRTAGVPTAVVPALALALPVSELAVGAGLLVGPLHLAALAALLLTGIFDLSIGVRALRGDLGLCHCFGRWSGRISWATVVRNGALSGGAVYLLWCAAR